MPSILNDDDKDTVKRFVPKQSNKIQAVAVARLFVAYPDRAKWSYTGLQGAIVLANDLVGNTYWLKMVDISPAGRGVIWDQEIYDSWSYNQDRTFFHTFELEDCLAGLSFVDEKEAKQFKKKMDDREKNASRATKSTPFGGGSQPVQKTSLLGGLFGYRHSSAPSVSDMSRSSLPPPPMPPPPPSSEFALLDSFDPLWREHFGNDLTKEGLTDDFIKDNQDFIIDFLKNAQAKSASSPAANGNESKVMRAPPPPPPLPTLAPPATSATGSAPAKTTSPAASTRRGAPPPPPAPRRSGKADPSSARDASPAREPTPPPRPRFSAPPPIADAGKYAHQHQEKPRPVTVLNPGPPPPPRPAKTPLEVDGPSPKFQAPPPFTGQRIPLPPPAGRGLVPPPPPPRGNNSSPQSSPAPPPLPPKIAAANAPPPLPPSSSRPVPPPPGPNAPLPPSSSTPAAPPPPPPPPPPPAPPTLPPQSIPPPASTAAPPPAPPPPPPLPPGPDRGFGGSSMPTAPVLPTSNHGRSAMLGDIQKAGGIGSLKKVDRSQIRDRSAAQVGGSNDSGPHASGSASAGAATAGGAGGGMADALAAALQKRKEKVSKSDDEDDDDDW